MKYVNGFNIHMTKEECFITLLQTAPKGQTKVSEEVENLVMSEKTARSLAMALNSIFKKMDEDMASSDVVIEKSTKLS